MILIHLNGQSISFYAYSSYYRGSILVLKCDHLYRKLVLNSINYIYSNTLTAQMCFNEPQFSYNPIIN